MRRAVRLIVGVGAAALVIAGCSTSKQVEDKIAEQFDEQLDVSADVTCPDDVTAEQGEAFDCVATVGDREITLHIEFVEDDTFNLAPAGLAMAAVDAAEGVKGIIEAEFGTVDSVDCGTEVILAGVGDTFPCTVTAGADVIDVIVTVDNEEGGLTVTPAA